MLWLRRKKIDTPVPEKQQAVVLPLHSPNRSLEFLTELIGKIRPKDPEDIVQAELQFQIYNDRNLTNPESWIAR